VRLTERQGHREDAHFTEGEPDLEPPEELAVAEVDEETQLEEDLDSRVDLEDEVDVEILESSLDHLVHDGDETEVLDESSLAEDLEIEDLEDRAESLDRILGELLAGDSDEPAPEEEAEEAGPRVAGRAETNGVVVVLSAWETEEFVCRSCFLVRSGSQRAGVSGSLCHDCSD
jgi:hypothetical protein